MFLIAINSLNVVVAGWCLLGAVESFKDNQLGAALTLLGISWLNVFAVML